MIGRSNQAWLTETVALFRAVLSQTDLALGQTLRGQPPEKNRLIVFYHQPQI